MKLDEIAKIAIDEVSAELKDIDMIDEQRPAFMIRSLEQPKDQEIKTNTKEQVAQTIYNDENIGSEEIFLKNLHERIEVLFEGLNETPKENLEHRLDITLKFLEFALANVEHRLNNIKK